MRKMKVQGKVVEFYTLAEIAAAAGKKPNTLRKMIANGVLPEANFRSPKLKVRTGERKGDDIPGTRLYSTAIYPELVKWLASVRKGSRITDNMCLEIVTLFHSERDKIKNL